MALTQGQRSFSDDREAVQAEHFRTSNWMKMVIVVVSEPVDRTEMLAQDDRSKTVEILYAPAPHDEGTHVSFPFFLGLP